MEALRGQTPYSDRTLWHFNSMFGPSLSAKVCGHCIVYSVWPLTASMEVKNKYAYVITQDICNKFIEVIFFVGCIVSRPNRLFQD